MAEKYILPHDLNAEKNFLCCLLIKREVPEEVGKICLSPPDFYDSEYGLIYHAFLNLEENGTPIDLLTIHKETVYLKAPGVSIAVLTDILNENIVSAHMAHYGKIVKEQSVLRQIAKFSNDATKRALAGEDISSILGRIDAELEKAKNPFEENEPTITEVFDKTFEKIKYIREHPDEIGIPTGLKAIDNLVKGFAKSDLVIIGASTSVGKTAFALTVCHNAINLGKKPVVISLEMSATQVAMRLLSIVSEVMLCRIRSGNMTFKEEHDINMARRKLEKMVINDSSYLTMADIRRRAKQYKKEGMDLLVIDYLGLVKPTDPKLAKVHQIAEITRGLKLLAKEIEIPILCLSQLNRNVSYRPDTEPALSDLRDSGAIEQDANIVILLSKNKDSDTVKFSVAKNRDGSTGDGNILFIKDRATFLDEPPGNIL